MSPGSWLGLGLFAFWGPPPAPPPAPLGPPALEAGPVELWRAPLVGGPVDTASRSEPAAPVIAGDRVLVGYSGARGLLVYDRRDGRYLGKYPSEGPVASAPVVAGDEVWFADTAGYTWCYRLDQLDGTPRWSHFEGAPVVSTPVLDGGRLYLTTLDDLVQALDAATGTVAWRYQHRLDVARSASLELLGAPAPVIAGDVVYAGFSDGFVVALGRADGSVVWSASVGEGTYPDLIAGPLPAGDSLIAGGFSGPLVSFGAQDRVVHWQVAVGVAAPLLAEGEAAYVPGVDGKLRKVEARTGEVAWTWDSGTTGTLTTPVAVPGGLLVGSGEGTLVLVGRDGVARWAFRPGGVVTGIAAAPAVVDRELYVVTNAGWLYAMRDPTRPELPERPGKR